MAQGYRVGEVLKQPGVDLAVIGIPLTVITLFCFGLVMMPGLVHPKTLAPTANAGAVTIQASATTTLRSSLPALTLMNAPKLPTVTVTPAAGSISGSPQTVNPQSLGTDNGDREAKSTNTYHLPSKLLISLPTITFTLKQ